MLYSIHATGRLVTNALTKLTGRLHNLRPTLFVQINCYCCPAIIDFKFYIRIHTVIARPCYASI